MSTALHPSARSFGKAIPVFRVNSVSAAIDYYTGALGFQVDWGYGGFFASVSRGQCRIFLSEGDQGHPGTWA